MKILDTFSIDNNWDFKTANTKLYTHCYHNYPAMMIPQIAERLINQYGQNAKILFDPYCGTGTSLVEANRKNINAIGTDLNPLARLISKAKTTKIDLQILDLYLKEFNDFLFYLNFGVNKPNIIIPDFDNIDFWFRQDIQEKLAVIQYFINNIQNSDIKNFFNVAFSETVRESSFTRNSEFKLYRMSEIQRQKFEPDVFTIMKGKLARNRRGLNEYLEETKDYNCQSEIFNFNTVESIKNIEQESIDIIVTSPPYGDSKTTVAYGQFSRLANQWLGIKNASQIDRHLMGGITQSTITKIGISLVDNLIEEIGNKDEKRGKEVYSFYYDYFQSINNVSLTLKKGNYACYVVGNRRVKGITLATDKITQLFFEVNGFKHENTFIRNIPNKRMPSKNSPTNETGITDTTMTQEYIVVMKKI